MNVNVLFIRSVNRRSCRIYNIHNGQHPTNAQSQKKK